jgi:hypothetical protein
MATITEVEEVEGEADADAVAEVEAEAGGEAKAGAEAGGEAGGEGGSGAGESEAGSASGGAPGSSDASGSGSAASPFLACPAYRGAKAGYMFKTGVQVRACVRASMSVCVRAYVSVRRILSRVHRTAAPRQATCLKRGLQVLRQSPRV